MEAPVTVRDLLKPSMAARWPNGKGELNLAAAANVLAVQYWKLAAIMRGERLPTAGELDALTERLDMSDADRALALRLLANEERGITPIQPEE